MANRSWQRGTVLLVLMLVLLLGGAWLAWQNLSPPPLVPLADGAPVAEVSAPKAVAELPPAPALPPARTAAAEPEPWLQAWLAGAEEPLAAEPDDPRAALLRGQLTVRQQPWQHLADVEVRLTRSWLDSVLPTAADGELQSRRDEPTVRTDAEGRFALRFHPTAGELFFRIGGSGPWQDFQKVPQQPLPGRELDLGTVWLDLRGTITGLVLERDGTPVAGVQVRAVDAPLQAVAGPLGALQDLRTAGLDHYRAEGVVRGGPIPAWVAHRDQWLPFPVATSDARGHFELAGLRPGRHDLFVVPSVVRPMAWTGALAAVPVQPGRLTNLPVLWVAPTAWQSVGFADEHGEPWRGAQVQRLQGPLGCGGAPESTDGQGLALLPRVEQDGEVLFAFPAGGPWLTVPVLAGQVRVTVPRPQSFEVLLFDPQGVAVERGTVRALAAAPWLRSSDRILPGPMQPRATGRGRFQGQCPMPMLLLAAAPGFAPAVARVAPGEPVVALQMLPLAHLRVRVRDLAGQPVPGAVVHLQADENPELTFAGAQWGALRGRRVRVGSTDAAGELLVPAWPARLSLQASHPDYAPSPGPQFVPRPDQQIELVLRGRAAITGQLLLQQRAAPPGYRVRLRQVAPPGSVLDGSPWLGSQLAVVGADGAFAARSLCAGIWRLLPELPEVPSGDGPLAVAVEFLAQEVAVADGASVHVLLEGLGAAAAAPMLAGSVARDGERLAGAVVRLAPWTEPAPAPKPAAEARSRRAPPPRRRVREPVPEPTLAAEVQRAAQLWTHRRETDLFGEFRFESVPAGACELTVELPGPNGPYVAHRQVVRGLAGAASRRVEVAVRSARVMLVATADGRPLADEPLRLWQVDSDGRESAQVDALLDGRGIAEAVELPEGRWRVAPRTGHGRCEPGEFRVTAGAVLVVGVAVAGR
jgi:hypothetical protein